MNSNMEKYIPYNYTDKARENRQIKQADHILIPAYKLYIRRNRLPPLKPP